MSAPTKLQGGKESELTRFKALWRTLADSVREYWREQFISERTQADIRREINSKLKINLQYDKQLNQFRDWVTEQDKRDAQAEFMQENERRLIEQHPDWSLDRVREEVIRQSYFQTLAVGDFKLGLKTVTGELKSKAHEAEERRYQESKRSDEEKALALCLEQARPYPEVQEMFKAAFAALKKAKAGK